MKMNEQQLAEALALVLDGLAEDRAVVRLRLRLRELGSNTRDEVQQFRQLQKACRESEPLQHALATLGLADLPGRNALRPDPDTGLAVQAFNRMVEKHWEPDY